MSDHDNGRKDNNGSDQIATVIRNWALAIIITILVAGYGAVNYMTKSPLERRLHACNSIFGSTNNAECKADKALYRMSGGRDAVFGID